MPGKIHEAVKKAHGVGLPVIPFDEGKVPGTGLSIAVSEYMQGVSNPQMPQEACADCGHEVCPEGCPCANPDCPGKKEQRPNGRMKGAEPLAGMAHEVRKAINLEVHEAQTFRRGQLVKWNFNSATPDLGVVLSAKPGGPVSVDRGGTMPPEVFKSPDHPDFGLQPASKAELAKSVKGLKRAMAKLKKSGRGGRAVGAMADQLWAKQKWMKKGLGEVSEAKKTTASKYLQQKVNFGGEIMPLGKVIKTLQKQGTSQKYIDRYVQGLLRGKKIRGESQDVTESTVVEIDGDKVTVWKDGKEKPAESTDPIKKAIKATTTKLQQEGNSATVSEMQSGLAKWLQMCRQSKRVGNDKRAAAIMSAIEKVIADKELDEPTVYNWTETFEGALTPEYSRSDFSESINDRNLFKAVFMAGGTGSGKSFIAGGMFKGTGARFVNSDSFFEYLLKKRGLPFEIDSSNQIMYQKQMAARKRAKKITSGQFGNWLNGMLPLVIDGTGKDVGKIKKWKATLEKVGYDTSMVLVNSTLDVALKRNKARKRTVDEPIARTNWAQVQKNIPKFQSLFGGNMMVVDNSVSVKGADLADLKVRMARAAMKMLGKGLRNQMGNNTIAALQRQGGKYISDIDPDFGKDNHTGI